jgi:hypothetical protein
MVEDRKIVSTYKLNLDVCKNSINFISTIQDKFLEKSWNCPIRTSFNTTPNILNIIELFDLRMDILSKVNLYMYETKFFFDGYLYNSWVNIYEKNFFQEYHNHVSEVHKFICGCVYLTNNNSEIEFNMGPKISPEFGDILIFEDGLMHRVVPNEKEDFRISLAFNFKKCNKWKGINLNAPY